jgi:hypothetical protein
MNMYAVGALGSLGKATEVSTESNELVHLPGVLGSGANYYRVASTRASLSHGLVLGPGVR